MGVLVVEDDANIRLMIDELLCDEGYRVATAEHGQTALYRLVQGPWLPRLILLDLMMPVMDGWTFAHTIYAHAVFTAIPIVIMSAGANLLDEVRVLPVVGALPKPIEFTQLLPLVERYCGPPGACAPLERCMGGS